MYLATGNDDVFALNAKTGERLWEHYSGIEQDISTVCCGWDNRGVAVGDGKVFVGQLDGTLIALDAKTGKLLWWQTVIGRWQEGYTITLGAALLQGERSIPALPAVATAARAGKLTALDAKTGKELWYFWTVPEPGDFGSDTPPAPDDPDPIRANAGKKGVRQYLANAGDRSRSRTDLFLDWPAWAGRPSALGPHFGLRRQSVQLLDRRVTSRRQLCLAEVPSRCITIYGTSTAPVR